MLVQGHRCTPFPHPSPQLPVLGLNIVVPVRGPKSLSPVGCKPDVKTVRPVAPIDYMIWSPYMSRAGIHRMFFLLRVLFGKPSGYMAHRSSHELPLTCFSGGSVAF